MNEFGRYQLIESDCYCLQLVRKPVNIIYSDWLDSICFAWRLFDDARLLIN